MKFKSFFIYAMAVGLTVTSCKKDDVEEPEPAVPSTNSPAGTTTPTPSDADGVMWAIKSSSTYQGFTIQIGTAVAAFMNGTTALVDVGTVQVDGNNMTKASNNAYTLAPSQSNPTGLSFGSTVNWNVAGGSGQSAFSFDDSQAFPFGSAISSSSTVTRANGYTLSCPTVSGADSTLFMVGNVSKTLPGSVTSYTFSAGELSGLAAGTSVVSIVPYSITDQTINGKKYYFGKETVNQLSVTIN